MGKIYDCHNHLMPGKCDAPEVFQAKAKSAGYDGGIVLSLPPTRTAFYTDSCAPAWRDRITNVLDYCSKLHDYFPAYWIDPTEPDAPEQVAVAKEQGIRMLKVLCSAYAPIDGLPAYRKAAEMNLPILFHSGILWDGMVSSGFNRPLAFEFLLEVAGLRFALAHVSWPWTDECIALYGKFLSNIRMFGRDRCAEMFIDVSPGAPAVYREDMFTRMVLSNYHLNGHVMFGPDSSVNNFDVEWARETLHFDCALLERLHEKYRDPAVLKRDSGFQFKNGETPDFHDLRVAMTERNFPRFIGEPQ